MLLWQPLSLLFNSSIQSPVLNISTINLCDNLVEWKPSEKDAAVLNSIAQEFSARIIRRNQGDQLAANLAYGLTESDVERVLGDGQASDVMKSVLSLKFADQKQINQFNKHQAIEMFSRGPNDTGSPEVQGTFLYTVQARQFIIMI